MSGTVKTVLGMAAAGLLLTGSGCQQTTPALPRPDTIPQATYPKVTLHNELAGWIAVNQPVVKKGDVLRVSVPIRLLSKGNQFSHVQYKFTFLDEAGAPMRVQPDWKFVTLEPQQQVFMEANSMDNRAADWRLEIRSAR